MAERGSDKSPPVVGFVALGCAKNLVDSEKMLADIAESGALITGDESLADTVVVNTCGFLEASRQEALDVLRGLAERKRAGQLRRIVVAGCLVQRDGTKLSDQIPEIDALVGVHNRAQVPTAVWGRSVGPEALATGPTEPEATAGATNALGALALGPTQSEARARGRAAAAARRALPAAPTVRAPVSLYLGDYHASALGAAGRWSDQARIRLTPRHYAYVRISEGCNQKCTFCTIPSIRGPMHCKTPDELIAECREMIADGASELILIGQDTTSYGADIGYEGGLAGLLRTLDAACDGARWIRLMYVYPSVFTDEMIDAIASCERVVKYIDIPLQHINDRMLKAMGRRVTRRQQEVLLEKLRTRIPGVTIRTTFIVGFPGETDAEFEELVTFVRDFGFDAVGAFRYSYEPETPAGRMRDQLDPAVKEERYARLMEVQQEVAFARAVGWRGREFDVVVDGLGNEEIAGSPGRRQARKPRPLVCRHAGQAPEVDAVTRVVGYDGASGQLLRVRCTGAAGYDLLATALGTGF